MNPVLEGILQRFEHEGPVNLHVEPEEYEALKVAVRGFWLAYHPWTQQQRNQLLAFLRGYTFYREIGEDEDLFWLSLQRELGNHHPEKLLQARQYDEIWEALGSHEGIAEFRETTSNKRMFVKTIARVWGYQVLQASKLLQLFKRYYNTFPGQELTPQVMRALDPQDSDDLVRQSRVFDRLFRQMVQVVDYLLDHDKTIVHLPAAALVERLQEGGLVFETPNPVLYFSHKSRTALAQLVGEVEGGARRRYRMRKPVARIVTPHPYVQASLAGGQVMASQPFTIDFPQANRSLGLELKLDSGQIYSVRSGKAEIDGLDEGDYRGAVTLYGANTGSTVAFSVLPPMEWSLTSILASEPVLEGQWQAGRVTLQDGRFGVFRWCPQWQFTQHWEAPEKCISIVVDDDVAVTLNLKAESYGARIYNMQTDEFMAELRDPSVLSRLIVSPLVPAQLATPKRWKAYFASQPESAVELPDSLSLLALRGQVPCAQDHLIVEFSHREQYYRALALPVFFEPKLLDVKLEHGILTLSVNAPPRSELMLTSERGDARMHVPLCGIRHELKVPLESTFGWTAQVLQVNLSSRGAPVAAVELPYEPGLRRATLLNSTLKRGVGWLPLK